MKNISRLVGAMLLCSAGVLAHAGRNYNLDQTGSSGTMRVAGEIQVADPVVPYTPTITLAGASGVTANAFAVSDTDGSHSTYALPDTTDANSLVRGDIGDPIWSTYLTTNVVTARKNAGSDGTYSDLVELNYSSSAASLATRAYLFVAPPGATSVTLTVPMKLPATYGPSLVRINISNAANTELSGLDCNLTSSLVSYSTSAAVVAGSTYVAQVVFNNPAIMAAAQPHALVGRVTLTATGATGVLANPYKRLQVRPEMLWNDIKSTVSVAAQSISGYSRLVFDTNANTLLMDAHYSAAPVITGADRAELVVYVNGRYFTSVSPLATSPQAQFFSPITLPSGFKRVEVVAGTHYNLNNWMRVRAVYVSEKSTLYVVKPPASRRVLVYGDSISVGAYASSSTANGWTNVLRDLSGYAVFSDGYAGRDLADDYTTTNGFLPMVRSWARANPTDVWLAIGTNDYGLDIQSAAKFGAQYRILLDTIRRILPEARIWAQTPLTRGENPNVANTFGDVIGDYRIAVTSAVVTDGGAAVYSSRQDFVNLVDGTAIIAAGDLLDAVHPTTIGHAKYAEYVYGVLSGSTANSAAKAGHMVFISSQNTAGVVVREIVNQVAPSISVVNSADSANFTLGGGSMTLAHEMRSGTLNVDGAGSVGGSLAVGNGLTVSAGNMINTGTSYLTTIAGNGAGVTVSTNVTITGRTNFSGIAFSSASSVSSYVFTETAGFKCITGSTLTWTSNGNIAYLKFGGAGYNGGGAAAMSFRWLIDGVPQGSLRLVQAATANGLVGLDITVRPTAGVRRACLATWVASGTGIVCDTNYCEWSVTEF